MSAPSDPFPRSSSRRILTIVMIPPTGHESGFRQFTYPTCSATMKEVKAGFQWHAFYTRFDHAA